MRFPALRTLPSRTCSTPSSCAISGTFAFLPLNANADVRAVTFRPGTCTKALMISSARPSLKYSCFFIAAHVGEGQHGNGGLLLFRLAAAPLQRGRYFLHGLVTILRR